MTRRTGCHVDKLSFTVDVPSWKRRQFHQFFDGQQNMRLFGPLRDGVKKLDYKEAGKWYPAGEGRDADIYVYFDPLNGNAELGVRRFARFEYNPSKMHRGTLLFIYSELQDLFEMQNFEAFALGVSITRLDLTFDVGAHISTLDGHYRIGMIFSHRYAQVQREYAPHGKLNSMQFGLNSSDRMMLVYDKKLQLERLQRRGFLSAPEPVFRVDSVGKSILVRRRPITRFELRLRDIGGLADLLALPNPWRDYHFYYTDSLRIDVNGIIPQHFSDSCKMRGLQNALSAIDDLPLRRKVRNSIRKNAERPEWWNAELFWRESLVGVSHL